MSNCASAEALLRDLESNFFKIGGMAIVGKCDRVIWHTSEEGHIIP